MKYFSVSMETNVNKLKNVIQLKKRVCLKQAENKKMMGSNITADNVAYHSRKFTGLLTLPTDCVFEIITCQCGEDVIGRNITKVLKAVYFEAFSSF